MGHHSLAVWLGFTGVVVALLVLDLAILNRRSHVLSMKEALRWSGSLVCLAMLFGGFLFLNTLYLQDVRGFSPIEAGLAIVPMAAMTIVISPIANSVPAAYLLRDASRLMKSQMRGPGSP